MLMVFLVVFHSARRCGCAFNVYVPFRGLLADREPSEWSREAMSDH